MKLNKLITSFENFFSLGKKERKKNGNEIDELMEKLFEKRKSFQKKFKYAKEKDKKEYEKKLKAVRKLIKKAKKNLY
ncbi:hypothetical protein [Arcobacter sp. LA11]|uniref:hypothetical protein n=1 Tax=Arcobacter sp. LA11 TaxID=1898176 RepID=UPI0009352BB2|nr:hypothetical protein [Arcobacter sp. LA11]